MNSQKQNLIVQYWFNDNNVDHAFQASLIALVVLDQETIAPYLLEQFPEESFHLLSLPEICNNKVTIAIQDYQNLNSRFYSIRKPPAFLFMYLSLILIYPLNCINHLLNPNTDPYLNPKSIKPHAEN